MAAGVKMILINGASANKVFWNVDGAVSAGAGAELKGNFFALAGEIALGDGVILEGRALTIAGAVNITNGSLAGCLLSEDPEATLIQPDCTLSTGTITITAPTGIGMTYSKDGIDFTNTSGIFTHLPGGEYTITARDANGCFSTKSFTIVGFGHTPNLGTAAGFILFTSAGALGNTGPATFITGGAIGTNSGAITGFGSVVCVQHTANSVTAQCAVDLAAAFNEIRSIAATQTIVAASMSGGTFYGGVYQISSALALTSNLTLDAQGDPDAIFIFKVTGAFSSAASVNIILLNGASVSNIFWNVDGAVGIGASASMKGTFLALAGEIAFGDGATLEGRALTIAGAANAYNNSMSLCIPPTMPVVTIIQPNCTNPTGTITITNPIAPGMKYRIDLCSYTNTSGVFLSVPEGTYTLSAKNAAGCISPVTNVVVLAPTNSILWSGNSNNEWNNAGNWIPAVVPGSSCDVVIPISALVTIGSGSAAVCNNLTIETGAVLTIAAGNSATVTGSLTNNSGINGLVIESSSSGTGSLIHSTSAVTATIHRFFNDANWTDGKDGWHFISSPVAAQAISPAFTAELASDYDFYAWYEPSNIWVNFKNNSEPPDGALAIAEQRTCK